MSRTLKSNTHLHHGNQKATWLQINDDEEKKEGKKDGKGKKAVIKGIYKRNSNENLHRKTPNGSATTREFPDKYVRERHSPTRPQSASAREWAESGREWAESGRPLSNRPSSSACRDSNLDFDFADKIKAFRSLIKAGNLKTGANEGQRSSADDVTSRGSHVRFNSRSLDGRTSAPNEFQLTYEQDKYLMNKRNYSLENEVRVERKHYSSASVVHKVESSAQFTSKNDENSLEMTFSNKTSSSQVIKRPTTLSEIDEDNGQGQGRHIASIRKQSRDHRGRNDIAGTSDDREFYKYDTTDKDHDIHFHGLEKTYRGRYQHDSSRAGLHGITSSPQTVRPTSTSDIPDKEHSRLPPTTDSHARPRSAIAHTSSDNNSKISNRTGGATISGRVRSNLGSPLSAPTLIGTRNLEGASTTLQTHLNVLGASLSSLSSIVNGSDAPDSTPERDECRIASPAAVVSSGISTRFDHSSLVRDSHRRGAKAAPAVLNTGDRRDVTHDARPTNQFSKFARASNPSPSNFMQQQRLDPHPHVIPRRDLDRPRSDEYLVLERLGQKVSGSPLTPLAPHSPRSPRTKQTNVEGMGDGEDSVLLSVNAGISSGTYSVSGSSRLESPNMAESEMAQSNLSAEQLSKQRLRRYIRYISRHRDNHMNDNALPSNGAKLKNSHDENSDCRSFSSSVKGEDKRVGNAREIQTQIPLSDYSDEDETLVEDGSANGSAINREISYLRSRDSKDISRTSDRTKIISRHKSPPEHSNTEASRQSGGMDDRKSPSTQSPSHHHRKSSQQGARNTVSPSSHANSHIVEKSRIIRRPPPSPNHGHERKGQKKETISNEQRQKPDRSHTALGLSTSKDAMKKYAILPSKYNAKGSVAAHHKHHHQRPHSALEGKVSSSSSSKEGRTAELMKKVHTLHQEVNARLKSDKNKSHSLTSSLTDLFDMVNKQDNSDDESDVTASLRSNRQRGRGHSQPGDTGNKTKVMISRTTYHRGPEVDIESGSDKERFSCASDNFISTSTPRKNSGFTQSRLGAQTRSTRGGGRYDGDSPTMPRRILSSDDSDDNIDGEDKQVKGHSASRLTNGSPESESEFPPKPRGLSDKLRQILYNNNSSKYTGGSGGGRGVHSSRSRYDMGMDTISDRSRDKERYRAGIEDDDKDEDESWRGENDNNNNNNHNNNTRRPGSASPLSEEWKESKARTISPFIKRLAYVDISTHTGGTRSPMDVNKIISGRASPADVLMGYLDNPNTVRLLQKLYQADPIDREIIMIKVLYFKAWLHFSTTSKQKRLRKQDLMECADTFCYQRILALHFIVWERNARYSRNIRHACALARRHMLSKGFRALRWAVSHSRHCKELIQTRYRTLTTRASFHIWKNRAVKQRRERMETTWYRWTQYVTEMHKIRHMQELMAGHLTGRVYGYWRKRYTKHMKLRMAFNYCRHTVYKHTLHSWSSFVAARKVKKDKSGAAVSQYQTNLMKGAFFQMVFAFKKSKKARNHFRQQRLTEVLWAWHEASKTCRGERQRDLMVSVEHCRVLTLRARFGQWKQRRRLRMADAHVNAHLYRNIFQRWITAYHQQFTKRLEIETALERKKLHRALLTWRQNVVQIQRRHRKAVVLIERCFLRNQLTAWRVYVQAKIGTRTRVLDQRRRQERKSLESWFSAWRDEYWTRLGHKQRQLLWSHNCARNVFVKWRRICRQTCLERTLEETQPHRELRFLHTMFARWLASLEKRRIEEEEAEAMRLHLEWTGLHKFLQRWRRATRNQLVIKPLIRDQGRKRMEGCFEAWRCYIHTTVHCRTSQVEFLRTRTRKCFLSWRRQYEAHKVAHRIRSQFCQGLQACCFQEWRMFVLLKTRGHDFRHKRLVARTFFHWKGAATRRVAARVRQREEESNNLHLKRQCFTAWVRCVQQDRATGDAYVARLAVVRGRSILATTFGEWKRLLHSTLIARAYQKVFHQRLLLTMLLEWRVQVKVDVQGAVGVFREKIGMAGSQEDEHLHHSVRLSSTLKEGWPDSLGLEGEFGGQEEEESMKMSVTGTLSSSFPAGFFSRLVDENSSMDSDTDRSFLLSGGLQDAAMSHQARCHKMKDIAASAIWRLLHWPTCVVFQQWREFTARQILLKNAAKQVRERVDHLETAWAFRQWTMAHAMMRRSRQYWDSHLMSSTLSVLHQHARHTRHAKQLAVRSQRHLQLKVFSQYFPVWLRKTQKQRREKQAVTLWTSSTAEEMELFPLESRLQTRLHQKTLRLCFSLWLLKVSHVQKIRHVYHTNTLQWVFTAWREWASYRQALVKRSQAMMCGRRVKMAWERWRERQHQSRQMTVLYHQAWRNYQTQILQHWHCWAKASHQRRSLLDTFKGQNSRRKVTSCFTTWRSLTSKSRAIHSRQRSFHLLTLLRTWRQFVEECKRRKRLTMQIQVRSYTLLVRRLFHQWHGAMVLHQTVLQARVQEAERRALHCGKVWRRRCQTIRGQRLAREFQYRQVWILFQTWQVRYSSVQALHERLEDIENRKNSQSLRWYLHTWVLALKGRQVARGYTGRLLYTIVWEWRMFSKESRERRKRGLALTKALQERSLHVYFRFWVAITKVKMSVRCNAQTRLLMRMVGSWRQYAHHQACLRQLHTHFQRRVQGRVLAQAFSKLRWRADYCTQMQEVADKIVADRVRATLTAVLVVWRQRLDNILAARCYGGILVVRVVRQWRRFVYTRKAEREKEMADRLKAVHFHHKTVCKRAMAGLRELQTVSKMAARHRQRLCDKYASLWKARVDMQTSAMEMEWDLLCWGSWRRWRREFARRLAARKMERDNNRHTLSQAFKSWRRLCHPSKEMTFYQALTSRSDRRTSTSSQLPVPKGRGLHSSPTPLSSIR